MADMIRCWCWLVTERGHPRHHHYQHEHQLTNYSWEHRSNEVEEAAIIHYAGFLLPGENHADGNQ